MKRLILKASWGPRGVRGVGFTVGVTSSPFGYVEQTDPRGPWRAVAWYATQPAKHLGYHTTQSEAMSAVKAETTLEGVTWVTESDPRYDGMGEPE